MRAGERIADVCQASYHDAGVAPESFDAVRELRRLLEESVASLVADEVRGDGLAALGSFGGLDGVPLRVRTWDAGGFDSETVVTSLRERSFAEADFQLPQGYRSRLSINIRGTSPQTP